MSTGRRLTLDEAMEALKDCAEGDMDELTLSRGECAVVVAGYERLAESNRNLKAANTRAKRRQTPDDALADRITRDIVTRDELRDLVTAFMAKLDALAAP